MRNVIIAAILTLSVTGGITAHQLATPTPSSAGCGVERWNVKTGSDAGAAAIDLTHSTWASIHSMQSLVRPAALPAAARVSPVETTNYRLTATLLRYKLEADSDIHLIIQGSSGRQMIAEIPSPDCLSSPDPFASRIAATRAAFETRYAASGTWHDANVPVRLTGVGFFDVNHGQSGVAPNAIEIHPVLSIRF